MTNLFSGLLTARDAAGEITDAATYSGDVRVSKAFITVTSNPVFSDVLMFIDIPSNAKLSSLIQYNENLGDDSTIGVGIYASEQFTDTDAARTVYLKNENIANDAFTILGNYNTTNLDGVELRFEPQGANNDVAGADDAMWQLAGLDSDPHVDMRIGAVVIVILQSFVAGDVAYVAEYSGK